MAELKAGRGPIYADMSWGSDQDQEYMRWAISNEGTGTAFLHVLDQYGMDFRNQKIEIYPIEPESSAACGAGPIIDKTAQTTIPGLFAAGDEAGGIPGGVASAALTMGHLCAESAAAFAGQVKTIPEGKGDAPVREFCLDILNRERGDSWEDAQITVQNIMSDYNIDIRSETMARRGLECMDYLTKAMRLAAANPHEITHCLEIRNLIECGEMSLRGTIERKESRYNILRRLDYPERDDENFFCFLAQRKENGRIVFEKRYT
jgi:adenylylsulfate reductase subunit A